MRSYPPTATVAGPDDRSRSDGHDRDVKTNYAISSSKRVVGVRDASSPAEALIDYLYGLGCHNDEIVRLRSDALSWRGAVFTATPVASDSREARVRAARPHGDQ
jgi:hypothetical protein